MKRIFTVFLLVAISIGLNAQTLIAGWTFETAATAAAPPILFLGSDLVYWECLYEPLEHALFHLLLKAPVGSLCLLAGMRRWKKDTAFYKSLGKKKQRSTGSTTSTSSWQLQCTCIQEEVATTTVSTVNNATKGMSDHDPHHRHHRDDQRVAKETGLQQQHRRREILRIYVVELVPRRRRHR